VEEATEEEADEPFKSVIALIVASCCAIFVKRESLSWRVYELVGNKIERRSETSFNSSLIFSWNLIFCL